MKTSIRLLPLVAVAMIAAACASSAGSGWTFAPVATTPPASPGGSPGESPGGSPGAESPGGSPGGNVIELEETADLRILRDGQQLTELTVTAGEAYTFRVTNTGGLTHNFYIGTAEALEGNQTAELEGIPEFTSGTEEFEWTAPEAGTDLQFACTVPGHYASMNGDLIVE